MRERIYSLWFNHILPIQLGLRNIRRWLYLVWHDEDCDWTSLAWFMEKKLRCMAECQGASWLPTNADGKHVRQMLTCAALLARLTKDDYFHNAGYDPETWDDRTDRDRARIAKHSQDMAEQDKRLLGLLIGKYLNHWWT